MYYIEFRAEGQALKRVDNQIVASDSKGFLYAKFDIDAGWDGLALEAVFEQNGSKYVQVLAEGLCPVPVEVLNVGRFKVWLTGVDSNTVTRATTSSLTIDVLRGPGDDAENASDPTPTEREQILTIASDAQRIAQSVRKDADEGKFDGKDGKSAYQIAVDNGFEGTEEEWLDSLDGGGSVDPKEIKQIVDDYLAENPPEIEESDPTVPDWAKEPDKPAYTAEEVGARPNNWMPTAQQVGADPVDTAISLVGAHNTSTGAHADIRISLSKKAEKSDIPTLSDLGGITPASVESIVSAHNVNGEAHNDLRVALSELNNRLNAIADSEDVDLNQLSEIVAYIKSNKTLIDSITTNKVSVSDIVDNLTTDVANKPLSAAQGVVLKALIDALGTNKLDTSKLTEAINTALAQAKKSGEFDGKDAPIPEIGDNGNWFIDGVDTGVTALGTVISDVRINDAGHLIVGFSDGSELDAGIAKGEDGDTGRGITKVERTSGTGAAGTTDTYTITYTDNTTSTFTVYNGKNGDPYTLTDSDKNTIVNAVKSSFKTETWTFELEDGTTVTKAVLLG